MFALKVVDGLSKGIEIPLRQNGTVTVGRTADADGQIEDGLCSARHFAVEWSEQSGIVVKDLGSLNGVFVNGERVREPRRVKRGDFIQAGTTLMELAVAVSHAGAEVRVSERAPAVKGAATQMMSSADLQDAIARTRAEARVKQKNLGRTVVKTQMLGRDEIEKLMAEPPTGNAKTMVMQALPQELFVAANKAGLTLLTQLLHTTSADSPAIVLVKKGAAITPHAKSSVTIGRDARNDVPLVSEDVSGHHARLLKDASGHFDIVDEGSTNGIYVNGTRTVRQTLHSGDVVKLGPWVGTIAIANGRLAVEFERAGVKVADAEGVIKVVKADAVGAKEWDPLFRERPQHIKVDYKRDRAELLAKKKKGKSADDIAWTATSDTQRKVLKGRLAWAGVVVSPIVVTAVLVLTGFDALAPGAVGAHHAGPEFTAKAHEAAAAQGTSSRLGEHVSCVACHQGGAVKDAACAGCHAQAPTERHTAAGLSCFDCHGEHNGREFSPTSAAKVGCVGCHEGDPHETLLTAGADKRARLRAPVISQEKLAIDAFDVHRTHMSIAGRCLGCHAEGLKPVAADARKTCGTCHAQARPEPDSCVTCHNQHPRGEEILAYLSTPVTPEDRLKAARADPGNGSILVVLALGICAPLTLIGLIKPKARSDEDEIVEEKVSAPSSSSSSSASSSSTPSSKSPAPPPSAQPTPAAVEPPRPKTQATSVAGTQAPPPTRAPAPSPRPASMSMSMPVAPAPRPVAASPHVPTKTFIGMSAASPSPAAKAPTSTSTSASASPSGWVPGQRGPTGVEIPPPPPPPRRR
jgi:pSer/pThr/pTyr-binding forkhead associated (FHA) protein